MNCLRRFVVWSSILLVIIFFCNCKEEPISDSNNQYYGINEMVSDKYQDIKWKQDIDWVSVSVPALLSQSYALYYIEQCKQANLLMDNVKLINEYNDPNGIILLPDNCFEKLLFTDARVFLSLDYIDVWCCLEIYDSEVDALTRYQSIKNKLDLNLYASDVCFQTNNRVLIINRRFSQKQALEYVEIFMVDTELDKLNKNKACVPFP